MGDDGKIGHVRLKHAETGETKDLAVGGAFVAIGHRPRSELVEGQVETNEDGYVITDEPSTRTKLAGVFAVGDLVDHTYRQAVTAAGSGTKGALDAEWYLRDMGGVSPEEHWGTNTGAVVEAVEAAGS
jgi:thioredoxin reductase (NADPH)